MMPSSAPPRAPSSSPLLEPASRRRALAFVDDAAVGSDPPPLGVVELGQRAESAELDEQLRHPHGGLAALAHALDPLARQGRGQLRQVVESIDHEQQPNIQGGHSPTARVSTQSPCATLAQDDRGYFRCACAESCFPSPSSACSLPAATTPLRLRLRRRRRPPARPPPCASTSHPRRRRSSRRRSSSLATRRRRWGRTPRRSGSSRRSISPSCCSFAASGALSAASSSANSRTTSRRSKPRGRDSWRSAPTTRPTSTSCESGTS